ncbi:MAG TPA: carboxypeptidase-like regulatory domain-containing protein [Terriglobia bacterium]|nr:carboxypeptidase-like regulatory domain-containing protein [Terriglobia bacterium]
MTRKIIVVTVSLLGVLLAACSVPLWGQAVANAQIQGFVTDPSGAAVPNAKVTASQTAMGLVRTTLSGPDGTYVLPDLPVGPYKLQVQASGFETYVQSGIVLEVSNNVAINVALHVGQIKQEVEVAANATMVQTNTTSVSQVVDQARIVDLPLNGRIATSLVMLAGAANDTAPYYSDLQGSKNYFSADNISVAGGQADGTNYLMDGAEQMDAFSWVNLPYPFPDALQEFSVETSSLSARYGFQGGATVNGITKSGTNQFHGDAFEFVRNGDFDARDFYAATQDTLRRNQFGGTIGGPIKKEKVFGFFGYQGTRIRTASPSNIAYVPTQAMLNGDFSALGSAACESSGVAQTFTNPATGQPFTNNQVDPALFNPVALKLLKYVPISSDPCGRYTYAIPTPQSEDQYIGRVDWNQSAKNSLSGRYFYANYASPAFFNNDLLLTTQRGVRDRSQSAVLSDTYSITPTTINSAHIAWTRLAITRGPAANFINLTDAGSQIYSAVPNFMDIGINGYFGAGCGTCAPVTLDGNSAQASEDVDMMRGRHHISFGGEWLHYQFNYANVYESNGALSFDGYASGNALLDFMLGLPSEYQQGTEDFYRGRQNYLGPYIEDDIRVSKRLNVNVGLRWEPYLPTNEKFKHMDHWDYNAFLAGKTSSVYTNAPLGLFFPGDSGIPTKGFTYSRLADFAPRVGLGWQPSDNGRQVIRAGFGVFYNVMPTAYSEDQNQGAPWASEVDLTSPPGGLTNPWLGFPDGNPFPTPAGQLTFVPEGAYFNYQLDAFATSVDVWNLTYQRQFANNWAVSASYMGNKTTHIWTGEDVDPGIYIPGNCAVGQYGLTQAGPCSNTSNTNQRRLLYLQNPVAGAFYSDIFQADDGANAEYNAFFGKVEHRFTENYTILANYTYSHCISEADFSGDLGGPNTEQPFNRNADRGNCAFDLRHIFNLSLVALSPHFAGVWTNRLLGNWQFAPIISVHSGTWFPPATGLDNSLTGIGNDRPNVSGNPYIKSTTGSLQWLNPSAFTANAPGTFGNAGMMALLGPRYFDVDAGVSRYFAIHENQKLELRFEFFNLGNNVNFSTPDNDLQDITFGQILGDVSPRILEFALKYTF